MFKKFREKRRREREENRSNFAELPITNDSDLREFLVTRFRAKQQEDGVHYAFRVVWKSDDKSQAVLASYAPVPELGDLAYFTAPLVDGPTEGVLRKIMQENARLLEGDLVMFESMLAMRITVPLGEVTGSQLYSQLQHFEAGANSIREQFADEVQSPSLTFGY
ncbi:hypothetical protein ACU19_05045 [Actinobaculum suis]|uniref:hypothetical protein n=1 Tax=Actinobaculum suis TaxID=1657 RepID=UPI00066FC0B2|nr:hypothetical protein [Actinobaculum suis]KMY23337.1 hypothetical protein ACU19_05045 [Actinobaculum suis]